jgi:hypothetical protein
MAPKPQKMPRSASSLRIRKAVIRLNKMSLAERIQLMVKAKLLTQAEADEAIARLAKSDESLVSPTSS